MILQILNGHVTPMLRRHGFEKFGKRNPAFHRTRDERIEIIDIQGDGQDRRYGGTFTVNVGVFFPTLDPIVSTHPVRDRPEESQCPIRARIGRLDTDGRVLPIPQWTDPWFDCGPTTDPSVVGPEVIQEIESRALAFLDRIATRQSLLEALHTEQLRIHPTWVAAIAAWAGDPRFAERILERELQESSSRRWYWIQRRSAATIAAALGLTFPGSEYPPDRELVVTVHQPDDSSPQDHDDVRWILHTGLIQALGETGPDRVHRVSADQPGSVEAVLRGPDPEGLIETIRPVLEKVAALPTGTGHPQWITSSRQVISG